MRGVLLLLLRLRQRGRSPRARLGRCDRAVPRPPGQGCHRLPGGRRPRGHRVQQRLPGGEPRGALRVLLHQQLAVRDDRRADGTDHPAGAEDHHHAVRARRGKDGTSAQGVRDLRAAGGPRLHREGLGRRYQAHHAGKEGCAQGAGDPARRQGLRLRGVPLSLPQQLEAGPGEGRRVRHPGDGEGVPAGLLPRPQRRGASEAHAHRGQGPGNAGPGLRGRHRAPPGPRVQGEALQVLRVRGAGGAQPRAGGR